MSKPSKAPPSIPAKAVVEDYVRYFHGQRFYQRTYKNKVFWKPQRILQRIQRDVHLAILTRWEEKKPCAPLSLSKVKVKDHRPFLPNLGSDGESMDYQSLFLGFHIALFGTDGIHKDRDDFYQKLSKPNLSREKFALLYFHYFYQNEEESSEYSADLVENLRETTLKYKSGNHKWSSLYSRWHKKQKYKKIDLKKVRAKNFWLDEVAKFRTYGSDPIDELSLVRNFVRHLNEKREKAKPSKAFYSKSRKGRLLRRLFKRVDGKLFDFMWDHRQDMDFRKSLSVFISN